MTNNPYDWMRPNPELFYGAHRKALIGEIISGLKRGESFAVVGGRRLGKTTFLRRLEKEIMEAPHFLFPVYIDAQALPGVSLPADAFNWIRMRVHERIGSDLPGHHWGWIRGAVDATNSLKLVLLIDEFDIFREHSWCSPFLDNLRALIHNTPEVSKYLAIVITGVRITRFLRDSPGSPLANVLNWKYLYLLDKGDTKTFVTDGNFGDDVADAVWAETGGHPFLIQYLLRHLFERGRDMGEHQALELAKARFLEEHVIIFKQWWFDHLEEDERRVYRALRKRVMASPGDIAEVLGYNRGIVSEHLRTLSYMGVVRRESSGGSEVYSKAGGMFDEWVSQYDVVGSVAVPSTASLHELVHDLEQCIRDVVYKYLKDADQLQTVFCKYEAKIKQANERYKRSRRTSEDCPSELVLQFSDFDFPFDIILDSWDHFYYNGFRRVARDRILGGDRQKAKLRFEERKEFVTWVRNELAHSRSISEDERDKAWVFIRDLLSLLGE